MLENIVVRGAAENNLRDLDVTIPRDKFVVLTGISGSGKSSLAFDTIYAEGQRRYMESLSSYARQFLGQMEKPNVKDIAGLSPAISIDQKTTSKNPRSTVGTVTEIYDYLRLMYARMGTPHCHICGREISGQSVDQIVDGIMELPEGSKVMLLAPVVVRKKGMHEKIIERVVREGFTRVRIDGEIFRPEEEELDLEKNIAHTIEIVVDRVVIKDGIEGRLAEGCESAIAHGNGQVVVAYEKETMTFSTAFACPEHGMSIEELEPRLFSFNSPLGACTQCKGLGFTQKINPELIIKTEESIDEGCLSKIYATMEHSSYHRQVINALAEYHETDLSMPYKDMPDKFKDELLYGTGSRHLKYIYASKSGYESKMDHPFEGLINNLERRYLETQSEFMQERIGKYMSTYQCESCGGDRLRPEILAVTVGDKNISQFCHMSVVDAIAYIEGLKFTEKEVQIGSEIIKEILGRLEFLSNVGLGYLTLARSSGTLSGGESQRIRLATQIGSGLVGVLYILDEPSIGLHQKDNGRLLEALRNLTEMGNTLLVVEHDEDTMYAADHIVDIGPGAGIHGGELVAQGTVEEIKKNEKSLTGLYLSGKKKIEVPKHRREGNGEKILIRGASENNLQNIDVEIPLGKFVCVSGVSGSGKSSLINQVLYRGVADIINKSGRQPYNHDSMEGVENIDKVIDIDQAPIGRTPRSNPATYTGVFTHIRDLFARMPEAKLRGYNKGRFSFNVKGGRCESCKGDGIIKIEMHFLPDVYVPCEVCKGKRYNRETLEVKYKGKNIFQVLDMNVSEALEFFKAIPQIANQLKTLEDVGLGYIKLGQPSTQLSGGEAQRIKLASELSKRSTGRTLYILDEPTTGLHFADVDKLLTILDRLTDGGNSVVVIEHNLDVLKRADHIIDLGPDGGSGGGEIVASGTPELVAKCKKSYTGRYLEKIL